MANPEHLQIIQKGVKVWNAWRQAAFPPEKCAFEGGPLPLVVPTVQYFYRQVFFHSLENMPAVDLSGADLSKENFQGADFRKANLSHVNLSEADLSYATLQEANLTHANLTAAILNVADLRRANLTESDLTGVSVGGTNFANLDLRSVKGLETVGHGGPSSIGIDTIYRSQGKISESFLRGAGVPENLITFMKSLTATGFQFYSVFISYSTKNQDVADEIHIDHQAKGVRCWLATEDLKIGDPFRQRIDESIKLHDKLLLILSEQSVQSPWVQDEVEIGHHELSLADLRHDDITNVVVGKAVLQTDRIVSTLRYRDLDPMIVGIIEVWIERHCDEAPPR